MIQKTNTDKVVQGAVFIILPLRGFVSLRFPPVPFVVSLLPTPFLATTGLISVSLSV